MRFARSHSRTTVSSVVTVARVRPSGEIASSRTVDGVAAELVAQPSGAASRIWIVPAGARGEQLPAVRRVKTAA